MLYFFCGNNYFHLELCAINVIWFNTLVIIIEKKINKNHTSECFKN